MPNRSSAARLKEQKVNGKEGKKVVSLSVFRHSRTGGSTLKIDSRDRITGDAGKVLLVLKNQKIAREREGGVSCDDNSVARLFRYTYYY